MADIMSPGKRSALMARIRARDTGPELLIRRALWHAGLRFRLNVKSLPGRPDIVLPKWNAAIFVHGCFWHRHEGCPLFRLPATRTEFWDTKLAGNRERDIRVLSDLRSGGWRVLIVWECALRHETSDTCRFCVDWVRGGAGSAEITAVDGSVALRLQP